MPGRTTSAKASAEKGRQDPPRREAWAERRFVICMRDRGALTLAASHLLDHLLSAD